MGLRVDGKMHIKDLADPNATHVVIYAGDHGSYWAEDACGYTSYLNAGIYTREDAYKWTRHAGPEKKVEFHNVPKDHIKTLRNRAELAEAENRRLRQIVTTFHWMARRYADGRMTHCAHEFNDSTKELLRMGIKLNPTVDKTIWATDGMGREYDGLTERQATPGTPEALGEV